MKQYIVQLDPRWGERSFTVFETDSESSAKAFYRKLVKLIRMHPGNADTSCKSALLVQQRIAKLSSFGTLKNTDKLDFKLYPYVTLYDRVNKLRINNSLFIVTRGFVTTQPRLCSWVTLESRYIRSFLKPRALNCWRPIEEEAPRLDYFEVKEVFMRKLRNKQLP